MAFTENKDKFEGILALGCVGDSGGSVERCGTTGCCFGLESRCRKVEERSSRFSSLTRYKYSRVAVAATTNCWICWLAKEDGDDP